MSGFEIAISIVVTVVCVWLVIEPLFGGLPEETGGARPPKGDSCEETSLR